MQQELPQALPVEFFIALAMIAAAGGIALFALYVNRRLYARLRSQELELARLRQLEPSLRKDAEELDTLRKEHLALVEEKSIAATERAEAMRQMDTLREERNAARENERALREELARLDKAKGMVEQHLRDREAGIRDREAQQAEMEKSMRASLLKISGEMSTKLLEDHKRESEAAKKEQEAKVKETTEALMKQFMEVTSAVSTLKATTGEARQQMETVMRALTHPAGAGQMAEAGLENSLKNIGLEPGRDFVMQYHITTPEGERNLRPDAVVFLPQDTVIVVDCKASKFLIELAEATTTEEERVLLERLRKSMNDHVKALASKNYRAAITDYLRAAGRSPSLGHVFNVMYLPSEAAIEKIRLADAGFNDRVEKAGLILAGPASLSGLFSLAKMNIAAAQRAENEQAIVEGVGALMESVATAFTHASGIGKSLSSAMGQFNDFARSVNARLLPRLHKLAELGVEPARGKTMPQRLATYELNRSDETLNLTAEEEPKVESLPRVKATV